MRENIQAVVSRNGRFLEGPAQIVADFTESISFDSMLAEADIMGSKAHAEMICSIGIITPEENEAIQINLSNIAEEITSCTSILEIKHLTIIPLRKQKT